RFIDNVIGVFHSELWKTRNNPRDFMCARVTFPRDFMCALSSPTRDFMCGHLLSCNVPVIKCPVAAREKIVILCKSLQTRKTARDAEGNAEISVSMRAHRGCWRNHHRGSINIG